MEITKSAHNFVGYEYKELSVAKEKLPIYLDAYQNFGWVVDENIRQKEACGHISLTLKRDRRILNKMELTRLQRNFEACMEQIDALERSRQSGPMISALTAGLIGTAFMAGSVFAITAQPPRVLLCILLAIPGFLGWILPYFLYRSQSYRKAANVTPLIEEKYEEIYELCKRGHQLLPQ